MLILIALVCLIGALIIMGALSYIDLKVQLLPNELVMGLACCGFVFHLCTLFYFLSLPEMILGAVIGGGLLYVIRGVANYLYNEDTLGLGDVKLLTAGGIWLGPEAILMAAALGAMAGFFHGLAIAVYTVGKAKVPMQLSKLAVPAGPGFIAGLIIMAIYKFWSLPAIIPTL
ncbi:MAG: prepilin peptidase [Alphaproteobacteria bacterium]